MLWGYIVITIVRFGDMCFTHNVDGADLFLKCLHIRLTDQLVQNIDAMTDKCPKYYTL